MWADIAAHFTLDPDRVASSGYSMGGYATYRLPTLYPDLFGKAFTQVGPAGDGIWIPPVIPRAASRRSRTCGSRTRATPLPERRRRARTSSSPSPGRAPRTSARPSTASAASISSGTASASSS
jgi:poly(3-hydroxybutyrate) depolymerase